jgi:hypothetical protein
LPLLGELTIATLRTDPLRPLSAASERRAKVRNVARLTPEFFLIFESTKREKNRYLRKILQANFCYKERTWFVR